MESVRFTKHFDCYNSGEVAGFESAKARELVAMGVAVRHEVREPATLAELVEEVKSRGYKADAAKRIARDRFDGKYGEEARYLLEAPAPEPPAPVGDLAASADVAVVTDVASDVQAAGDVEASGGDAGAPDGVAQASGDVQATGAQE